MLFLADLTFFLLDLDGSADVGVTFLLREIGEKIGVFGGTVGNFVDGQIDTGVEGSMAPVGLENGIFAGPHKKTFIESKNESNRLNTASSCCCKYSQTSAAVELDPYVVIF